MTRKHVFVILFAMEAALIGLLFLPVATCTTGSGGTQGLTAFDLAQRYSDLGHTIDSGVYLFFALCCPAVSILAMFLVHNQRHAVGVAACLGAMNLLVHACFYTALKSSIAASVTMSARYVYLIVISLFVLLLSIYAYLCVTMNDEEEDAGKNKKAK